MTTTIAIDRDSKLCDFTRDIVEPCLGPTQGIIPAAPGVAAVKFDLGQDDPTALACLLVPEHHRPVAQLFLGGCESRLDLLVDRVRALVRRHTYIYTTLNSHLEARRFLAAI